MLHIRRKGVFLLAFLCLVFGTSPIANAYTVYDCWTSHEGWGESAANFTTNSQVVYFNVSCSSYYTYINNKWYRPNGTEENDIGTNVLAHWVYEGGFCVGFYAWMVIEGKDRESGEWRVEHWAQDVYNEWHLMCTNYITITEAVSNPTFSPSPGIYNSPQEVAISCSTPSATIHYTTDGNEPTKSSPIYSSPINISETTTIKVKAYKDGLAPSDVITGIYTIATAMPWLLLLLGE
jgi:hypothetical protein